MYKEELKGFPDEIVDLMVFRYSNEEGTPYNESLKKLEEGRQFDWGEQKESFNFWNSIHDKDFSIFYKKYPNYIIKHLKTKQDDKSNKKNGITDSKSGENGQGRVRISSSSRQVTAGKSYIGYAKSSRIQKTRGETCIIKQSVRCF